MVKEWAIGLSNDQKKYMGIGVVVFLLLIIYGVSKSSDVGEKIVIEPTKESFKGGDIVSNNAADYYRSKGQNMARQYEEVKSSQKLLEEQLKEIKVAIEKQNLASNAQQTASPPPDTPPNTTLDFNQAGGIGKKMTR